MAGLFDRFGPNAVPTDDRIPVHLMTAAVKLFADGQKITGQQVIDAINAKLVTPLSPAAEGDINAIGAVLNAFNQSSSQQAAKALYSGTIEGAFLAYAEGALNYTEAKARADLGI